MPSSSSGSTSSPVSSRSPLLSPSIGCSPSSVKPPGMSHLPPSGSGARRASRTRPSSSTTSAPEVTFELAYETNPQAPHSTRDSSPRSSSRQRGHHLQPLSSPTAATIGGPCPASSPPP